MRRSDIAWLKLLLSLLILFVLEGAAFAIEVGDMPSDFALQSNSGTTVALSQYKGKVVIVDFWASWCGSCAQSIPWLTNLQRRLGKDKLMVIAVNLDEDPRAADEFLKNAKSDLLVAYDPKGSSPEAFNIRAMPTSYLLDRNGKVVLIHEGFAADDREMLETEIEKIVREY